MNFKTTISSDSANGKAAWLQTTDMSSEGVNVVSKMWIDKTTFECLKILSVMEYNGQKIEQPSECPTSGPNSASGEKAPAVNYLGKESVTVPAGTYNADKYSSQGASYWTASGVPIPVKIESSGTTFELVSYS